MNCSAIDHLVDDYLDGTLPSEQVAALERHAKECPSCRALLARAQNLRQALRDLPAPEPSPGFLDRAIAEAVMREHRKHRRMSGPVLALAASVMLVFAIGALYRPGPAPVQDIPGLAIAPHQIQDVSLVLESDQPMENAHFTIRLPEGIEVSGYPGQRELSWEGRLAQGKNLLVLPVEATMGRGGELVAVVTHTGKKKNFCSEDGCITAAGIADNPSSGPVSGTGHGNVAIRTITMRIIPPICLSMFIAASLAGNVFAAEGTGDLDITIRMMDTRQSADEFINRIELPKDFGAATTGGPSNRNTQTGPDDKRKHRDGVINKDGHRDSDEGNRSDTQPDRPSTDDADRRDSSDVRDRADESRQRHENFRQSSREQQESTRQNSRENWDKFRDSYPPSAWPDRQK